MLFFGVCKKDANTNNKLPHVEIIDSITALQKLSLQIFGNKEFKFNKNDSNYLNSIKQLTKNFNLNGKKSIQGNNERINSCDLSNGDSTYEWYSDPENIIIEGPYSTAKNVTYETIAENCPDLISSAEAANQYLIDEGYSDIAYMYYGALRPGLRYQVIHAANSLIELKTEFIVSYEDRNSESDVQEKLFNCVLQAVGYATIAELGSNWATMSRQHLIKAVDKLASKYLNWIGAAVAVGSFIDCMWF